MGAAAFGAMLGTCIAVMDGYARSLSQSLAVALGREAGKLGSGGPADRGGRWPGHRRHVRRPNQATRRPRHHPVVPGRAPGRVLEPPTCGGPTSPGRPTGPWPSGVGWGGLAFLTAFTLWFLWINSSLDFAHQVQHLGANLTASRVVRRGLPSVPSLTLGSTYGVAKRAAAPCIKDILGLRCCVMTAPNPCCGLASSVASWRSTPSQEGPYP